MPFLPAYQPLMDELLGFITRMEHEAELRAGRAEYVLQTGEVFDDDRSFDARMQAFLDWFIFDRPLRPYSEPPVRVYATQAGLDDRGREEFRLLGRTVHGLFEVRSLRKNRLSLLDLPTGARYELRLESPIPGLETKNLFEGRLVPHEGDYQLSPGFIFHPPHTRGLIVRELRRQRRTHEAVSVQDVIFTLSRMAIRVEHYRNVQIDAIYDFERPPPKVWPAPLRFDPESVALRLGRATATPGPPPGAKDGSDPSVAV